MLDLHSFRGYRDAVGSDLEQVSLPLSSVAGRLLTLALP